MRNCITSSGSSLHPNDRANVEELRRRLGNLIPSRYDTDFNIYRWLLNADKTSKSRDFMATAERNLRHHLRYRKALRLDSEPVPSWEENPIHQDRLLPKGVINGLDRCNRLLWVVQYESINMEGLMQKLRSSEMLVYHFWIYEELRSLVNEQEARTGTLSALHAILDVTGYSMNPFSMLFISNGAMSYYAHLFHYEHYPELVSPIVIVNAAKWMSVPYRLIKSIMPQNFTERFRVHDTHFLPDLLKDFHKELIPQFLGGSKQGMCSVPARHIPKEEYWQWNRTQSCLDPAQLNHLVVGPRRRKIIPLEVFRPNTIIYWYFVTDAELQFGIFLNRVYGLNSETETETELERMEMVEPMFRLAGRLVPEEGTLLCQRPGLYYLVFCNKAAWLSKRNVYLKLDIETSDSQNIPLHRTFSL